MNTKALEVCEKIDLGEIQDPYTEALLPAYLEKIDHIFGGKDPLINLLLAQPNYRLFIPNKKDELTLKEQEEKKNEMEQKIANSGDFKEVKFILESIGYKEFNLKNKLTSKDGGKNWEKIGKVLERNNFSKTAKLWKALTNKNSISSKTGDGICISINPIDILSCSYGRSWSTCLNPLRDSNYTHYLDKRILSNDYFSLICYEVREEDEDIKSPRGRFFIHLAKIKSDGSAFSSCISERYSTKTSKVLKHLTFTVYGGLKPDPLEDLKTLNVYGTDTTYGNFSKSSKRTYYEFMKTFNKDIFKNKIPQIFEKVERIKLASCGYYNDRWSDIYLRRHSFHDEYSNIDWIKYSVLDEKKTVSKSSQIKKKSNPTKVRYTGYDKILFADKPQLTYSNTIGIQLLHGLIHSTDSLKDSDYSKNDTIFNMFFELKTYQLDRLFFLGKSPKCSENYKIFKRFYLYCKRKENITSELQLVLDKYENDYKLTEKEIAHIDLSKQLKDLEKELVESGLL